MFTHPTLIAHATAERTASILAEARARHELHAAFPPAAGQKNAPRWLNGLRRLPALARHLIPFPKSSEMYGSFPFQLRVGKHTDQNGVEETKRFLLRFRQRCAIHMTYPR